jgi:hypothetical protein
MRALLLSVALLVAAPVAADPGPQLVQLVQSRLRYYNLHADVSQFATPTVAALHLALSSPEGYMRTRRRLKSILANPVYKGAGN